MTNYKIISDGSCDLSLAEVKSLDIEVAPFYVELGDKVYLKENVDISVSDFYTKMLENPGVFPKSSLPSIEDYYKIFKKYASLGQDIICLCITRKFSGSFNSAMGAKDLILEEYPKVKITVVDTIVNTVLQGLVVKEACRLQNQGASYEEVIAAIENHKETGRIFFTVKDLSYLQHGGRIGKVASIIGNILKISPLITLKEGEIFSGGIAISRNRAILKVKDHLLSYLEEVKATPATYRLAVGYGCDKEEGEKFLQTLKRFLPDYDIDLAQIGATIAVHTGPYPLGVGVIKKFN